MSKDNILFSIIGLLLGVIVGYVFANAVNQRGYAPRASAGSTAGQVTQDSRLHDNKQAALDETGGNQAAPSTDDEAVIAQAKSQPDNFEVQMQAGATLYQNRQIGRASCRERV